MSAYRALAECKLRSRDPVEFEGQKQYLDKLQD